MDETRLDTKHIQSRKSTINVASIVLGWRVQVHLSRRREPGQLRRLCVGGGGEGMWAEEEVAVEGWAYGVWR